MLARIWRGATRVGDRDAYLDYLEGTGIREYRDTRGNIGVYVLRRDDGERTEFLLLSLWESEDAVRAFAGDDTDQAVFYPEDDRFLVERDLTVTHWEAFERR